MGRIDYLYVVGFLHKTVKQAAPQIPCVAKIVNLVQIVRSDEVVLEAACSYCMAGS